MQKYLLFLFLSLVVGPLLAQEKTKKTNLVLGTSVTYLPIELQVNPITGVGSISHTIPWQLTFGYEFHPSYRLSLDNKLMLYKGPNVPWQTANLIGLTHQFNFLSIFAKATPIDVDFSLSRLFVELSTHVGDFCFCEDAISTLSMQKVYVGFGVGFGIKLSPKLDLDLTATTLNMLAPPPEYIQHFHYVIGIDYYFRPRTKKPDVL